MRGEVLVATWGGGGNLPPLLSVAALLAGAGCRVRVLVSAATRPAVRAAGFQVIDYRRGPDPRVDVPFEAQAEGVLATIAGAEIAADVHEALAATGPDVLVADCMLPAALAAGEASGTPTVSVVHFLYGTARGPMARTGDGGTTDLPRLNATRRTLGLGPVAGPVEAWEAPDLVLVTAPRWLDAEAGLPPHVVHAGPLGVRTGPRPDGERARARPHVLISFSTTVMAGQTRLVRAVCDAVAETGVEALLTLGPAMSAGAMEVPANVTPVAFADHDQVLPHCDVLIGHAGLGTGLRALAHGVPQLLLPLGRDQHVNAARIAGLGAGITLPADSPPTQIRTALTLLLREGRFRTAARRAAARIATDRPDRHATRALVRLLDRPDRHRSAGAS
ncbi:glycosyltransferase [Actinomadura scrupuli]|uniref:glycosyltransferase n=1 Tax=Actinomadura scrupuli TaxID=559629 RepID=UPI003D970E84